LRKLLAGECGESGGWMSYGRHDGYSGWRRVHHRAPFHRTSTPPNCQPIASRLRSTRIVSIRRVANPPRAAPLMVPPAAASGAAWSAPARPPARRALIIQRRRKATATQRANESSRVAAFSPINARSAGSRPLTAGAGARPPV